MNTKLMLKDPKNLDTICNRVVYLMIREGYSSVYDFSKQNGEKEIRRSTVYNIVDGKTNTIRVYTAQVLARQLGSTVGFIMRGESEKAGKDSSEMVIKSETLGEIRLEKKRGNVIAIEKIISLGEEFASLTNDLLDVIIKYSKKS